MSPLPNSIGQKREDRTKVETSPRRRAPRRAREPDPDHRCPRTEERQLEMYKLGKSKTLQSKHLIGYAVDLYPLTMDRTAVEWDGFGRLADLMFKAADAVGARIVWGGNWKRFVDKPHFELSF